MVGISPTSCWYAGAGTPPAFAQLEKDLRTDVAIIGGGITGLTAALLLKRAGRRVAVLEAHRVGAGTTGGTSAHLEALPDQGIETLIGDHGEQDARLITRARLAAITRIEQWCQEFGIDADFARVPAFAYSESADGARRLAEQLDAARSLGLQAEIVRDVGLPFPTAGGLKVENQARFHPLKYVHALARLVHGDGSAVYEQTRVLPPEDGEPCQIRVAGSDAVVSSLSVLLCTHSAFLGISELDMRIAPYQSYVLTASSPQEVPDALYFDDESPYHYIRRASGADPNTIIVGGADHKTGHENECEAYRQLDDYFRTRFGGGDVHERWSAEFFEPSDGLPFVGLVPFSRHLYVATGFSGTGLTFGTMAAEVLCDVLLGRESAIAKIVTPSRLKPLAAAGSLISENLDVAKRFVMDRLSPEKIESLEEIAPGSGCLARYRGHTVAACRERGGKLHLLSPVCTHAGCYVQWNEAESTWDCPCHGGRYAADGTRIYGPPAKDLEKQTDLNR